MSERRRFLSALAAAPLLPAALTQATPAPPRPAPSPSASPFDPGATTREAAADALTDAARRVFGERFPAEQATEVRDAIRDNLRAGERLKALGLGNADEPVAVFTARMPSPPPETSGGRER